MTISLNRDFQRFVGARDWRARNLPPWLIGEAARIVGPGDLHDLRVLVLLFLRWRVRTGEKVQG